ncbi:MAG TPA: hypothetical protein PKD17_00705 [Cellvibrionaceae bacterium]|nr:hypothetical protein [Cellvibrionaceae bacterium]
MAVFVSYPWVWAILFLATLGVLLICLAKLRQQQKDLAEAKHANSISSEEQDKNIVLAFLVDQFDRTKRLNDNVYFRHDELDRHACSLRSAYLKIEEKSLKNNADHRRYHLAINKSLVKLLKIIRDDAIKTIDVEGVSDRSLHEALDGSKLSAQEKSELLNQIEEFCEQLKSGAIGVEFRKKRYKQLLAMIKNVENTEERVAMKKLLLLAESADASFEHYSNLSESIFNAGSDVAALQGVLDGSGPGLSSQVQAQLDALGKENMKLYSQVQMLRQWSKENKKLAYPEGVSLSSATINDVSEEIINKHEEELKALKATVRNQKLTIFELENSLDEYRKSEHAKGAKSDYEQEFGALTRRLTATEDLISEQEKNVGRMRTGLEALNGTEAIGEERETLMQCIEKLKKEVTEAKEAYTSKNVEFDFISELIAVGSLEDLALLVFQYFCDQKCDPFLLISHKGRNIEMSATGALSVKDKTIINAMMPNDASKDDERFQLQFRYHNFGGILRFLPGSTENYDSCEALLKMAKITDAFIEKISSGQNMRGLKKQLEQCSNDVKQLAQTVDIGFEQICQAHRQLISNHITRGQNLLRVKSATAAQIACLKQMETDMLEDMAPNGSVRIKMRKEFLALVKKIEQ